MKKSSIIRILALVLTVFTVFTVLPGLYASSEDAENNIPPEVYTYNEWERLYDAHDLKAGTTYSIIAAYCRSDTTVPVALVCVDGNVDFAPLDTSMFNYSTSIYTNPDDERVVSLNVKQPYLKFICGETDLKKEDAREWYIGTLSTYAISKMCFGDLITSDSKYFLNFKAMPGTSKGTSTEVGYRIGIPAASARGFYDKKSFPYWFIDDDQTKHPSSYFFNEETSLQLRDYEFALGVLFSKYSTYWVIDMFAADLDLSNTYYSRYKQVAPYIENYDKSHSYTYGVPVLFESNSYEDRNRDCCAGSARIWYSVDSFLTKYTGEKYVVTSDSILHIDDAVTMIDEGTEFIIEPGAVVTVSGDLINNGTITNYGTLILEENASVLTQTAKGGMGSITCKGTDAKYYKTVNKSDGKGGSKKVKVTLSGEGTIIINDNAKLSLKKDAFLSLENGTTCLNDGYLIIGGGITMNSASFINHGSVGIGYYETNTSNFEKRDIPVVINQWGDVTGAAQGYAANFNAKSNFSNAENYVEKGKGWYDNSQKVGDSKTVFVIDADQ